MQRFLRTMHSLNLLCKKLDVINQIIMTKTNDKYISLNQIIKVLLLHYCAVVSPSLVLFFIHCFILLLICLRMHIIMTIKATFYVEWKETNVYNCILLDRWSPTVSNIHLNSLFAFDMTMWQRNHTVQFTKTDQLHPCTAFNNWCKCATTLIEIRKTKK